MDGVERIMVLGIFAVIVSILGVAAWSVTQDDGSVPAGVTDGGTSAGTARALGSPLKRLDTQPGVTGREAELANQKSRLDAFLANAGQGSASGEDLPLKNGARNPSARPPAPTGNGPGGATRPAIGATEGAAPGAVAGGERQAGKQSGAITRPSTAGVEDESLEQKRVEVKAPTTRQYTLREGDTVWQVAQREVSPDGVKATVAEIARLNPSIDLDRVFEGTVLVLPVRGEATPLATDDASGKPSAPQAEPGAGFRLYTVQAGDSLSSIAAEQLGSASRYLEIYQLNKRYLSSPDHVSAGQTLKLPVSE